MSNDIYSRDRQPYNFPAGLKVKGIDLSGFDGAKAVSLRLIDSDQSPTNLYDWVRSTHSTVESILANGVGGNSGPITTDNITDATPFGISLLKASSQTVAQNLLGLGTYVTVLSSQISDATVVGKTLLTAPSIAYVKTSLGLGTAANVDSTTFATALQGTKADSALQPGALPAGTTIPVAQISNGGTVGKSVLLASTQAIAQTALGLGTAAVAATTAFATAAQGTKADTALQPGSLPVGTSITASQISDSSSIGRSLITVTSQAALQTIIGVSPTTSFTASQISDAGTAGVNILKAGTTTQAQAAIGLPNASTALQPGALPVGTTVTSTQISDASVVGKQVLTATTASSARTSLGLGTAATSAITDFATSAQGTLAGSALQPGALPTGTTIKINQISDASTVGTSVLGATTQALAQSYLGLGSAATQASTAFATAAQGTLATNAIPSSAIGVTVAGLTGGKLAASVIPDIAISQYLGSVASQTAMLALTGQYGDWCVRSDTGTNWIITGATPTLIGSWTQLTYPASSVVSVAGRTGAVTLSTADISGLGTAATLTAGTVGGPLVGTSTPLAAWTILGLESAASYSAAAFATANQGIKADSALQPSTQLTQANVTAATLAGVNLLKSADAAAQRTLLGLGTAATQASTAFAAATHTQAITTITGMSTVGSALTVATSQSAGRTALGLGVNDNTTYYGTWAGKPTPTQAGEKYIITDIATKGKVNVPLAIISTAAFGTSTYTYSLENGHCVLHEGTTNATVSNYTSTATQIPLGFQLKIPSYFNSGSIVSLRSSNIKLTLIYELANPSTTPTTIQVRYGTTGTATDTLYGTYSVTTQALNIMELNVLSSFLDGITLSWDSGNPSATITKLYEYVGQGVDTYFTIWVQGGSASATMSAHYYKVELNS